MLIKEEVKKLVLELQLFSLRLVFVLIDEGGLEGGKGWDFSSEKEVGIELRPEPEPDTEPLFGLKTGGGGSKKVCFSDINELLLE